MRNELVWEIEVQSLKGYIEEETKDVDRSEK